MPVTVLLVNIFKNVVNEKEKYDVTLIASPQFNDPVWILNTDKCSIQVVSKVGYTSW